MAAGILSSKVMANSNDVLLEPTHCGRWWKLVNVSRSDSIYGWDENVWGYLRGQNAVTNLRRTSNNYAKICYDR